MDKLKQLITFIVFLLIISNAHFANAQQTVSLSSPALFNAVAGEQSTMPINISNYAATAEIYAVSLPDAPKWVLLQNTLISLNSNETKQFNLTINATPDISGNFPLRIKVALANNPEVFATYDSVIQVSKAGADNKGLLLTTLAILISKHKTSSAIIGIMILISFFVVYLRWLPDSKSDAYVYKAAETTAAEPAPEGQIIPEVSFVTELSKEEPKSHIPEYAIEQKTEIEMPKEELKPAVPAESAVENYLAEMRARISEIKKVAVQETQAGIAGVKKLIPYEKMPGKRIWEV